MTANPADFPKTVAEEAEFIERFVHLLEEEETLLNEGRTEALAEAIEKKEELAAKLNALSRQRGDYLADHGFSPDRAGMESWSAAHPEQKETIAAWGRTLLLTVRAKELNRVNGQLIRLRLQHTGEALKVLLREEGRLDLYGPDGRATTPGDQRINDAV
jgi:flagellar biosynthesis/type III secretory pathway chaperone